MANEPNQLRRIPLDQISPNQEVLGCRVLLEHKDRYLKAVAEGFQDEVCGGCNTYFAAYKHFVRCDRQDCPMKDGNPSLLDQLLEVDAEA